MAKISELKDMIIALRMSLIRANIPDGHCPYAYYQPSSQQRILCDNIECNDCKRLFFASIEQDIIKEVRKL